MTAGVSRHLYDKYDLPNVSKAKIARFIFSDLKPSPDAPDQQAGRAALTDLEHEATVTKILVDSEKAAAERHSVRWPRRQLAF
jgi:hypothetical protein